MDVGPEVALAVITVVFSAGGAWQAVKSHKRNGEFSEKDKKKLEDLDLEVRGLKVLLLGVEGQGGIVSEIRESKRRTRQGDNSA